MKRVSQGILLAALVLIGVLFTSCNNNIPCPVYAKQGHVANNNNPV